MAATGGTLTTRLRIHDSRLAVGAIEAAAWYPRCACGWVGTQPHASRDEAVRAAEAHRDAYRSCGV